MALTAELCRAHGDKGDRDIKLDFAKELTKAYIIDLATKYGPDYALRIIEELGRGFHTAELAEAFTRYIKSAQRTAHKHIRAVTLDRQFMDGLKQLVIREFGSNNNVGNNTVQHDEEQKSGIVQDVSLREVRHRADVGPSPARDRESVEQVTMDKNESLRKRLALAKVKGMVGDAIEEPLLMQLSSLDLIAFYKKLSELPLDERSDLINEVRSLLREGRIGEAKALIHGRTRLKTATQEGNQESREAQPQEARDKAQEQPGQDGQTTQNAVLTLKCDSEEACNVLRELSRASREGDVRAMLEASLALATRLADALGMGDYARLLEAISRNAGNAKLINSLLAITELAREDIDAARAIADEIRAIREGNLRELCAIFNDLIGEAMNRLPREVRESIKNRVNLIDCRQYPGPEELGL